MPDNTEPKPPPPHHPGPTPLALVLGRLNVRDPGHVMIGMVAAPTVVAPTDEEDRLYFAWVRVHDGIRIGLDEVEAMALREAGAQPGTIPRCPACGEAADYGNPIDLQRDAWNCVDDGPFIYSQG